jgi:hypothetical protein
LVTLICEFALVALLCIQVGLFCLGSQDWVGQGKGLSAAVLGALHAIAIVLLGLIFDSIGIASLKVLALWVLATQLWGIYSFRKWRKKFPVNSVLLMAGLSCLFWMVLFRETLALPSFHDGIAHGVFYQRALQQGFSDASSFSMGFGDAFGFSPMRYYPMGTSFLLAVFTVPWIWLGVPASLGLKVGLLASLTALGAAIPFWVKRVAPSSGKGIEWACFLLFLPLLLFPARAATEGGVSRLLGYALVQPLLLWLAHWGSSASPSLREKTLLIAVAVLWVPLFQIHPTLIYALVAMSLSPLFSLGALSVRRREVLYGLVGALLGGLSLLVFVRLHQGDSVILNAPLVSPFSEKGFIASVFRFPFLLWDDHYSLWFLELVLILGVLPFWKATSRIPYFRACLLVSFASIAAGFIPSRWTFLFASLVHQHFFRLAEFVWPLCLGVGACGLLRLVGIVQKGKVLRVFVGVLCLLAVADTVNRVVRLRRFVREQAIAHHTPEHARFDGVIHAVLEKVPKESLLIGAPGSIDILESITGRKVLFQYHECPGAQDEKINCKARVLLYKSQFSFLEGGASCPKISTVGSAPWIAVQEVKAGAIDCGLKTLWESKDWRLLSL